MRTYLIRVWFYGPWVLAIIAAVVTAIVLRKPKYLILAIPSIAILFGIWRTEKLDPINEQTIRGLAPCYKLDFGYFMFAIMAIVFSASFNNRVIAFLVMLVGYGALAFLSAGLFYVTMSHARRKIHPFVERFLAEQKARNS